MRKLLDKSQVNADWHAFSESWNNLPQDEFMADGGRYRSRRHCVFTMDADGVLQRLEHQPHYQQRKFNAVNGGINRWFAPIEDMIADNPVMRAILDVNRAVFCADDPAPAFWRIEMHQMRIKAMGDKPGKPTPEGLHRDGVDCVFIMFMERRNIGGGITTITDCNNQPLAIFHLTEPLDALFLDDRVLKHSVSPVWAVGDTSKSAHRDALIVTWKRIETTPSTSDDDQM